MGILSDMVFVVFVGSSLVFAQQGEKEELLQSEKVVAMVQGKQITYEDISPGTKMIENKHAELSQGKFDEWLASYRKSELRGAIFRSLLEAYAQDHKIEPTEEEIRVFVSELQEGQIERQIEQEKEAKRLRKRLESPYLSEIKKEQLKSRLEVTERLLKRREELGGDPREHSAEAEKIQEEIAKYSVKAYRINKSLYDKYGGRVIFQQAGLEPLDAYRRFLEEHEKKGSFQIKDKDLAEDIWEYFTSEKHPFFSEEESATVMETPWWLLEEKIIEGYENEEKVKALIVALKGPTSTVQHTAARVLGKIGEPAVEPLIDMLKQTGENERLPYMTVEALAQVGEPAVKQLVVLLKDENRKAREAAAIALGKIEDESSVESLITALKDTDKSVRSRAAQALGNVGDTRAIEPLITVLRDEKESVRTQARVGLEKITGKDTGQSLEKWQQWWEENKQDFLKGE